MKYNVISELYQS